MKRFKNPKSMLIVLGVSLLAIGLITLSVMPSIVWGEEEDKVISQCPKTLITDQSRCLTCHVVPDWGLKEADPDRYNEYPNIYTRIVEGVGHYNFIRPDGEEFAKTLEYFKLHGVEDMVIDIESPGGSLFDAWRITALMDEWPGKIATQCRSYAASAACIILMSGDKGCRRISETAVVMWHEFGYDKWMSWNTPSSTEDEAQVNRMIQDTQHEYMAKRCNLTKDELDDKVKRKEFWLNPTQAIELGFVDGFIGQ